MKTIYAVHQGYELYGSDRSFIQCLEVLRANYPEADLQVLLPQEGPLSEMLTRQGFNFEIRDLWILRKSYGLGLIGRVLIMPAALWRAHKVFKAADLVYINTAVVADYLLMARLHRRKAVAHIREIPTGLAHRVVSALVRWSRATLFFNSQATADAFESAPGVQRAVIYNGFEGPAHAAPPQDRGDGKLRLLMLGRINDWKGQDLLVEAVSLLSEAQRRAVEIKVVGDAFEGQPYRRQLEAQIAASGLGDQVSIEGFVDDPSTLLQWSDVVVVPSRKPEPFGRVAIEGMAWARPVIAARHGGLVEIIEDERTGLLFAPNDPHSLSSAISKLIGDPDEIRRLALQGWQRYLDRFTQDAMATSVVQSLPRVDASRG
ncbi:glycosyl transferase family 1 [Brevundimonas intermedia]|uniref:Glycosyl transferase family 1 n=1 Tax=Brevundimonas intermedia TaxID=74315 RepID=A0ABQ5TAA9_9CAUL|nr:glycosyltransferase family 4 protein [Brevundimonas intermedia]GLK49323.1 glycosyl transferase family 1 [Brevundimonas intermedia]